MRGSASGNVKTMPLWLILSWHMWLYGTNDVSCAHAIMDMTSNCNREHTSHGLWPQAGATEITRAARERQVVAAGSFGRASRSTCSPGEWDPQRSPLLGNHLLGPQQPAAWCEQQSHGLAGTGINGQNMLTQEIGWHLVQLEHTASL